jgi:transcriptional regulator with XRE-family HTH domain
MSDGLADAGKGAVGSYIKHRRELSRMSQRELARLSRVSNAYLSQIERGLHEPSLRVLNAVAEALSVPVEELLPIRTAPAAADDADAVTGAIAAEGRLTRQQKDALLAVYNSYLAQNSTDDTPPETRPSEQLL